MTSTLQKHSLTPKTATSVECWQSVPVIVNGIASYNFYYANNKQY